MESPEAQHNFQQYLWERLASTLAGDPHPEAVYARVAKLMTEAQQACFCTEADATHPRKPWTSWETAQLADPSPWHDAKEGGRRIFPSGAPQGTAGGPRPPPLGED